MKTFATLILCTAAVAGTAAIRTTADSGDAMVVAAEKAPYKEVAPGVMKALLWGDPEKGPYAAFTKFPPGAKHALHSHTNDIHMVVLKGAYLYWKDGKETRVPAGSYASIPGGEKHVSGSDAKEGCTFYESSQGKFDIHSAEGPENK
jgi:quercetin dioxygenase-like cupin family protein